VGCGDGHRGGRNRGETGAGGGGDRGQVGFGDVAGEADALGCAVEPLARDRVQPAEAGQTSSGVRSELLYRRLAGEREVERVEP
jgi:hypothetical protein